jgi:hypothetical protein
MGKAVRKALKREIWGRGKKVETNFKKKSRKSKCNFGDL